MEKYKRSADKMFIEDVRNGLDARVTLRTNKHMYDFSRYLNIRSANHPYPSPDGTRVAFLSDITGNYQVWSTSTSGNSWQDSWPTQLTFFPDKVWEVYGTHSADHLLAVSDVGGKPESLLPRHSPKHGLRLFFLSFWRPLGARPP